eukprot:scaffold19416_cov69-Attheya_sp.AAC.3
MTWCRRIPGGSGGGLSAVGVGEFVLSVGIALMAPSGVPTILKSIAQACRLWSWSCRTTSPGRTVGKLGATLVGSCRTSFSLCMFGVCIAISQKNVVKSVSNPVMERRLRIVSVTVEIVVAEPFFALIFSAICMYG